jgi:hypothetical protein
MTTPVAAFAAEQRARMTVDAVGVASVTLTSPESGTVTFTSAAPTPSESRTA